MARLFAHAGIALGALASVWLADAHAQDAQVGAGTQASVGASTQAAPAASTASAAPTTTAAAADGGNTTTEEPKPELAWDLLHRRYNTWSGPSGGLFLVDPSNGEVGSVRLALGLGLFSGDDVLNDRDHVEHNEQSLSLGVTATKVFEIFASLATRSTASSKPSARSLDSIGDISLGGKVGGFVAPVLSIGGDLRVAFANQVGGGGGSLEATSIGVRGNLGLDLQRMEDPAPFIARLNLGYYFDNSAKIVKDIESSRYARLNSPVADEEDETRHLVDRFERLAMGINRLDRFSIGVGVEIPLEVTERFFLHPLLEWRVDVPANRQGYDCPFVKSNEKAGTLESREDSCYERSSGDSFPMALALGVRAVPPIRGVSITLGADFGLNSTTKFVRELAPTLPYRLLLVLAYDYDARPIPPVIVQAPVPAVPPPAPQGRIQGIIGSSEGGPVANAIVAFVDRDVSAVATSSDGHFLSEAFDIGEVQMEVSHPDFETARCATVIPEGGGNVEAKCTLSPKPRVAALRGRVIDAFGSPVSGARLQLNGPSGASAVSDVRGNFEADNLVAGEYSVRAEQTGYFVRLSKLSLEPRATANLDVTLVQKPATPGIMLRGMSIVAKGITFQGESTDLDATAAQSIAELADLMLTRTDLNIRVQGYGSDAVALSRALLIKQRLVDGGVPDSRIEAAGGAKGKVVITVTQ